MYLHGGHVTSWTPQGRGEALYLSPRSEYREGQAIRGGVPVCFPWFGNKADDGAAPAHGFARTRKWELESVEVVDGGMRVSMSTVSDEETKRWWPSDFQLVHRVTFGAILTMELEMTNRGTAPLRFEQALHSYFRVGDCRSAQVGGLDEVPYLDKTDSFRLKIQHGDIRIEAETDRVYGPTATPIELADPVLRRRIRVTKKNSRATVVWNPWVGKSETMKDLGKDEYLKMLCVEVANVGSWAVELEPGETHTMRAKIEILDW